jgi:hypothetical protein
VVLIGQYIAAGVVLVGVSPVIAVLIVIVLVTMMAAGVRRRQNPAAGDALLDGFAAENGMLVERLVSDPDTPGRLFRSGSDRLTVIRLRRSQPRLVEVGRFVATASSYDGERRIDCGYVVVQSRDAAARWAEARETIASDPSSTDNLPSGAMVPFVERLPRLEGEGLPGQLYVDTDGEFVIVYSPRPFELEVAATWRALAEAVRRVDG